MVKAERIRSFGTSIFTEISRLAAELGAVNLGQGFPDFAGPEFVKEAAVRAIRAEKNQYAPSHGVPRLRAAIAERWSREEGRALDPDREITVASGATELLCDAMLAFVNPGDEVVILEPFYDSYVPDVLLAGGVPRFVRLRPPDWSFDPAELRAAFGPRTRLILLNTPHNPTGKVFDDEELDFVATLCQEHDVLALTDEVYSEIVYDGARHARLAARPGMWERTLTLDSTGKTFSLTGWKVGFAVGPAALTAALRAVHQFVTFSTATPLQEAMADAMEEAVRIGYYAELRAAYAKRKGALQSALEDAGLPCLPIRGSYFLLADVSKTGFPDDVAFCRHLVRDVGVAAIPPSAFYSEPARAPLLARFCFAKREETIAAAAERLRALRS
jgi:aspartate/methionine/tyrosine aminotransferase